jgi:hypothetical protein
MDSFLLASQRLTRSRQGETDYKYFELFLETVSGFPSVLANMAGYYIQYPAILQQSLATLFLFLENWKDHLTRGDPCFFTVFRSSKTSPTSRYSQPPASVPPQQQQQPHQAAAAAG